MEPAFGSSPLARGTPARSTHERPARRFIPARAGNTMRSFRRESAMTVHPRSRGEHPLIPANPGSQYGSSPLARGTLAIPRTARSTGRFIPARAGNTRPRPNPASARSVHPRSRGEHAGIGRAHRLPSGSSPLARGTPGHCGQRGAGHRFIPARAGNTIGHATSYASLSGSSPLARGTRNAPSYRAGIERFIPARAGNTAGRTPRAWRGPVHPRSRGEHGERLDRRSSPCGSSPLARGTQRRGLHAACRRRFIPARAGNTRPAPSVPPSNRGSSPLARGTLMAHWPDRVPWRFIPARAGNTSSRGLIARRCPVHPRSRGEHRDGRDPSHGGRGSSPLARGTPPHGELHVSLQRFIPARAGNTRVR